MLSKKLIRDIKINKTQFLTIFLMVFLGVFAYTGITAYMTGMQSIADNYYEENNFQDIWIEGVNFTDSDLDKIESIDNVKEAERKLTLRGSSTNVENSTLEINFIEENNISKFYVVEGESFSYDSNGVWVDSYFAKNNNIKLGDTLNIKYDTYSFEFEVVGLILVPDHIYNIKSEAEIFPTHTDFGFVYISSKAFPLGEDNILYTTIMVDVDNLDLLDETKLDIENKLENALAVTDREANTSYQTYQGEIEEGHTYVGVFSGIFLFISVLSVITTMTRVVKKQRTEIGTLKALGFKNSKITMLYIGYGFWVSLIASVLGMILGTYTLGLFFLSLIGRFYEIPSIEISIPNSAYLIVFIVVIVVSLITYLTCRSQLNEKAANILRVESPNIKNTKLNLNKRIFKKLGFSTKWNIRDCIRSKARTIMGIVGITSCSALIICAFGMFDSLNEYLNWQFNKLYNFNYKISMKDSYTENELENIILKYGDSSSETLAIELKLSDTKATNTITVDDSNGLLKYSDIKLNELILEDDGIYVTNKFAQTNNLKIGDVLEWHIYGDDTWYSSKIIGFNRNPQTQNITMTRSYLESLGIEYKLDSIYTNQDLSGVEEIEGASNIQDKNAIRQGMENMLENMKTMIVLIIAVAIILGIVIIYNLGVLSFTEKNYQFATLKVLGFDNSKIEKIFIKQNIWITFISIVLGIPAGYYMTYLIFKMALSDSYDMNASISIISYMYGVIGTYIVSYIVNKILSKKINKINMVESLKGNE